MNNKHSFSSLCIASSNGGGGKTLLTLGLGRALTKAGWLVKPFKKGPDYIDAAWLSHACNIPATNIDPFFLNTQQILQLFQKSITTLIARSSSQYVLALLEGNRGLYDGLDESGSCSTANIAKFLNCPVLLCLNSEKCTRTMAAIINGLTTFETGLTFSGVILNRVGSSRHAEALRKAIELNTDIKVMGILPRLSQNPLPERHMGLASFGPALATDADTVIDKLGTFITENCDVPSILASLPSFALTENDEANHVDSAYIVLKSQPKARIGYVFDSALWFYYPENLEALRSQGAELVPLKIIGADKTENAQWNKIDALYLGGGFPEDYASDLEQSPLLEKIANFASQGMPIYAECGGMMLLCDSLMIKDKIWKMAGIFPQVIKFEKKPQGLGYVEAELIKPNPYFPLHTKLKGHEFHYSACVNKTATPYVMRLSRGIGMGKTNDKAPAVDGLLFKNVWASYTHIFAPANPLWAENFVKIALNWRTHF